MNSHPCYCGDPECPSCGAGLKPLDCRYCGKPILDGDADDDDDELHFDCRAEYDAARMEARK